MSKLTNLLFAITLLIIASCQNNINKKIVTDSLVGSLKVPSSFKCISFAIERIETLQDEVEERLDYYNEQTSFEKSIMQTDSMRYEYYTISQYASKEDIADALQKYEKSKKEYSKTLRIIEHLNDIKNDYPALYNKTSFVTYKLEYEAKNPLGVPIHDICRARFNIDNKLVAIKYKEDSEWVLFEKFFSIPGYYELVEQI